MRYLFDTDILIDYLGGNQNVVSIVEHVVREGAAISVVSYLEAFQGALRTDDIEGSISDFSHALGYIAVVGVTVPIAQVCARIRYELARMNRKYRNRSLDLIIAATAIEYGLALVTRNKKHFDDIPDLKLSEF